MFKAFHGSQKMEARIIIDDDSKKRETFVDLHILQYETDEIKGE